ncbi:helix-turn-helix transcriptional regulator [Phreatobacter aquaticus]|uniref:Helix-turn-helix transcriptional regulator n=1 Tax=Phreatobacter aquaticus TaxID=2570229 RepID=A0A4D7QC43_9HYPH|nr:metalloregulator ArsR/SmtB family transcription factor [Phreatobacter aquaticus]QCK84718.1 helix-turn-helix transcriptional regulator [Phreatobacter aquaticus]
MEKSEAIKVLAALAQPTRLDAFRHLVAAEPNGIAAGDLARLAGVPQNTLSAHLAILVQAGLARSQRHSRSIVYHAEIDTLRAVTVYLFRDCCQGRADLCMPLINELSPCCAVTEPSS